MANVAANMSWALDEDALKAALSITNTAEDVNLERWLTVAIEQADLFMDEEFVDDDGLDLPFPESVREGVFIYVKVLRERRSAVEGVQASSVPDLSETYASPFSGNLALRAAAPFWSAYADSTLKSSFL